MHTVELLEEAIELAQRCGFGIRQEWLGGATAGVCRLKGRDWIFVDHALTPREQLDLILAAISQVPQLAQLAVSPQLQKLLNLRKAA